MYSRVEYFSFVNKVCTMILQLKLLKSDQWHEHRFKSREGARNTQAVSTSAGFHSCSPNLQHKIHACLYYVEFTLYQRMTFLLCITLQTKMGSDNPKNLGNKLGRLVETPNLFDWVYLTQFMYPKLPTTAQKNESELTHY